MIELLHDIMKEITDVLDMVEEEQLTTFMSFIKKENRILVEGEGRSGLQAKGFAMRLMHLGYTVFVVGDTITPALKEEDIFIAISGSGESDNVLSSTKKAIKSGCTVLSVTSKPSSSIASLANSVLVVPGTVRAEKGEDRRSIQLLSTLFDQTLHIVLDTICLLISRRDHLSNEEVTKKHW